MKTVTSISGGKSSAYIAANYPADYLVFSLVRSSNESLRFKDKYVKQMVEDKKPQLPIQYFTFKESY